MPLPYSRVHLRSGGIKQDQAAGCSANAIGPSKGHCTTDGPFISEYSDRSLHIGKADRPTDEESRMGGIVLFLSFARRRFHFLFIWVCLKAACATFGLLGTLLACTFAAPEYSSPPLSSNQTARSLGSMSDKVSQAYYINLAEDRKRRTFMEGWLDSMMGDIPVNRVEAQRGNISEHSCVRWKAHLKLCQKITGLAMTNLNLMANNKTQGLTLVLEDDIGFERPLQEIVSFTLKMAPEDWDIIRWDCWGHRPSTFPVMKEAADLLVFRTAHSHFCNSTEETCSFCGGTHAMLWKEASLSKISEIWAKEPLDDIDCRLVDSSIKSYCVNMKVVIRMGRWIRRRKRMGQR